jgi:hypothetical protein
MNVMNGFFGEAASLIEKAGCANIHFYSLKISWRCVRNPWRGGYSVSRGLLECDAWFWFVETGSSTSVEVTDLNRRAVPVPSCTTYLTRPTALGLQIMGTGPFADAGAGFQAIFARRSEMNTAIHTAIRRFTSRSQRCWKAAVHTGQKI